LFKDCSDLVKAAKLPLSSRFRHPSDYYHTQAISDSKAITLQSINGMINWLTRDALYDLQLNWEHNISIMDDFLGQATRLLAAATCPAKNLTTVYGNAPPPVELAQSITTITKLSILFFRKLLRSAIKQITAQSFTTIDSNPMRALTRAAEDLCWNVEGLVDVLGYARVWTSGILEIIEGTEGRFEGVIRLITSNIFPLIPGGDNPCSVNYLNAWLADWRKLFYAETERLCSSWFSMLVTWLANWNNLFLTATKNCISAAESYNLHRAVLLPLLEWPNRGRVIYGTNQAFDMINRTIKWLQGHEFYNIREDWDRFVPDLNSVLLEFDNYMILVVFYILPLIPGQVHNSSSQTSLTTWLVNWKHLFLIATKDFISAAKLLRLIYGTNEAFGMINRAIKWLKGHEFYNIRENWKYFVPDLNSILLEFDKNMLLVLLYILPLIPGQDNSSSQTSLATWLTKLGITQSQEGTLSNSTAEVLDSISCIIKWLKGNELDNIQMDWEHHIANIDRSLGRTLRYEIGYYEERLNGLLMGVLHQFDTVMRLIILYILPLIPQDPSSEQNLMAWLVDWNNLFLDANKRCIRAYEPYGEMLGDADRNSSGGQDRRRDQMNGDTEYIVNYMNEVLSDFDTSRLLVVFYVLPLIPDQVNHPSSQNPLTTWLVDWNHLLLIAVQNCISAVKLL
ncbi:hypothetical protein PSTT_03421, partial [Puccinia striiformis]